MPEHLFAILQFGFPLLAPVSAQTARHDQTNQRDQPEPQTFALLLSHWNISTFLSSWFARGERLELREQSITLTCLIQRRPPWFSDFVIFAWRTLFLLRKRGPFPFRKDVPGIFKSPQRGINRTTGESSDGHDVEPIAIAMLDDLQDQRHRVRKIIFTHPYPLGSVYIASII